MSAINGVAGAFAERVPVVAITGSLAMINFRNRPLLHHTLGDYQIPLRMYEKVTVASTQLVSAETAPAAAVISADNARVTVRVIRTDEELMIVRSVSRILSMAYGCSIHGCGNDPGVQTSWTPYSLCGHG